MNFNDRNFGHKNLLVTQDKIGQSCTLFSKARVSQSLLMMVNAMHHLFPSLVMSSYNHR